MSISRCFPCFPLRLHGNDKQVACMLRRRHFTATAPIRYVHRCLVLTLESCAVCYSTGDKSNSRLQL